MTFLNIILAVIVSLTVIGCDENQWLKLEKGSENVAGLTATGEKVGTVLAPWSAGYGATAVGVLGGLGNIALAIAALAKAKKVKAIAKAASEAAELTSGGGKALVMSSLNNGVMSDVKKAYDATKKIGG